MDLQLQVDVIFLKKNNINLIKTAIIIKLCKKNFKLL